MVGTITTEPRPKSRQGAHPPETPPLPRRLLFALQQNWISVLAALLLVGVVIVPIIYLIAFSFRAGTPSNPGEWTIQNYKRVYSQSLTYEVVGNTVIYATLTLVFSIAIAAFFAWLLERTDVPGRNIAWVVMLLPIAMPGMLSAMAWTLLLSERTGWINVVIRNFLSVFGVEMDSGPFNIYSLPGMIFVESIRGSTTLFLMMVASFRLMDPALEEVASMSGAGNAATLRLITAPLLKPILLATAMYGLISNLEDFDTPLLIGLPAGVYVLSTFIYFSTYLSGDWGLSAVYTTMFLFLTVAMVALYQRLILRRASGFATVSGKAFAPRRIKLGKWKWPAFGVVVTFAFLAVVLPLLIIAWASLLQNYENPSMSALSGISLDNYWELFGDDRIVQSFWNSFVLGIGSALATMILAFLIGWAVVRQQVRGKAILDALSFIPHALPSVAIVIALVAFYLSPSMAWLPLYGTVTLMIIAMVTRYIAFGTRTANGAMIQIDRSLEEAAAVSGIPKGRTLLLITGPLILPAFIGGAIFVGSHAFRNLTIPLMMASRDNETIAVALYATWYRDANFSLASAIGVVLTVGLGIVTLITRRWIMRGYSTG